MTQRTIALNSFELVEQAGTEALWVQLLPAGEVVGRDGRMWLNSMPQEILSSFAVLARDLPIDIEHSTERKAPKGEAAPAIGWVRELESRNGEIWGRIEWTTAGAAMVAEKAYRYLSPVILYNAKDNTIVGITSVGLTNQPNLHLPALNTQQGDGPSDDERQEDAMDVKALLKALGLPEDASEQDVQAKIKELKDGSAKQDKAQNSEQAPDLTKFVPRGDYDAAVVKAANAEQRLADLDKAKKEETINTAIDQALKDGKITPATREYHIAQCRQEGGMERFAEFCKIAPTIGADSGLDKKRPEEGGKALNAEEQRICEMLNLSEEVYLKTAV